MSRIVAQTAADEVEACDGSARVYNRWVSCHSADPTKFYFHSYCLQLSHRTARCQRAADLRGRRAAAGRLLQRRAGGVAGARAGADRRTQRRVPFGAGGGERRAKARRPLRSPISARRRKRSRATPLRRDGRLRRPRRAVGASAGGVRAARGRRTDSRAACWCCWRRPTCRRRNWRPNFRDEPTADELHRAIRRFRRTQAAEYAVESLLGESAGDAEGAGPGRGGGGEPGECAGPRPARHGPRAHWRGPFTTRRRKRPASWCRSIARSPPRNRCGERSNRSAARATQSNGTRVLLLNLEQLPTPLQSQLLPVLTDGTLAARFVVTLTNDSSPPRSPPTTMRRPKSIRNCSARSRRSRSTCPRSPSGSTTCRCWLSIFSKRPITVSAKQVGCGATGCARSTRALSLAGRARRAAERDRSRPRNRRARTKSRRPICRTVIHHAAKAAAMPRREPEKIVLDEFLESIEREVITRAMAQAGGNKSAAAELLGMNRPRLYRRLVQLGLHRRSRQNADGGDRRHEPRRMDRLRTDQPLGVGAADGAGGGRCIRARLRETRLTRGTRRGTCRPAQRASRRSKSTAAILPIVLAWLPHARQRLRAHALRRARGSLARRRLRTPLRDALVEAGVQAIATSPRRLDAVLALARRARRESPAIVDENDAAHRPASGPRCLGKRR